MAMAAEGEVEAGEGAERWAAVASAPGKVLLTGAYLVLEPPHAGLVLAASARFYAAVRRRPAAAPAAEEVVHVRVVSPQLERESSYRLSVPDLRLERVPSVSAGGNPFIEKAIQLAVGAAAMLAIKQSGSTDALFSRLVIEGMEILLLGDNDFYSHRTQLLDRGWSLSATSLALLPAFAGLNIPHVSSSNSLAPELPKTGLGSSAAMTTAAVAALLHFLQVVDLQKECCEAGTEDLGSNRGAGLEIVHRIAQAAHCLAQGKIGSGFDVSAATFGSQRYVRFSPTLLQPILAGDMESSPLKAASAVLQTHWDGERTPWALPPGLLLMIGEPGTGGSSTPSMVGAVLKWRKEAAVQANRLWADLSAANNSIEEAFTGLSRLAVENAMTYRAVLEACSSVVASEWVSAVSSIPHGPLMAEALLAIRTTFLQARVLLRELGRNAQVPIEPQPQTELLDATMEAEGVLFAGIPGAGGFDAAFALVLGSSVQQKVDAMWSSRGVLSLCVRERAAGLQWESDLPLRGES